MANPPDQSRRSQLLDTLVAEFAAGGVGDRSLRDVAAAVGTSHRMLLHHFGSREEMLVAIVEQVERRQMTVLPDYRLTRPITSPRCGPTSADQNSALRRLFFECYARAANGEQPFDRMIPGAVDDWLALTEGLAEPAAARLGLAVIRGLLLDLVATGDGAGVDAAAAVFVSLLRRSP